jgi:hypothetical protein
MFYGDIVLCGAAAVAVLEESLLPKSLPLFKKTRFGSNCKLTKVGSNSYDVAVVVLGESLLPKSLHLFKKT